MEIRSLASWMVSDIAVNDTSEVLLDENGQLMASNYELPGVELFYWRAPSAYLGSLLRVYGSELRVHLTWLVMRGDTSGKPLIGPDLVLRGRNGMRIAYGDVAHSGDSLHLTVLLTEKGWYHVPESVRDIPSRRRRTEYRGDPVTRNQFLKVLVDVEDLLIRAKFHADQLEGYLHDATIAITPPESDEVSIVEECTCPQGYSGLSCESCAFGYALTEEGDCVACDCNGHSATCDLKLESCGVCEHNTTGARCERCLPSFYGNALSGVADACRPCACPLLLPSNNFSPSCALDGVEGDKYFCTQCPDGYTGDHCEICDYGFWGSPMTVGGVCTACACGGAPCDPTTGRCLVCPNNTHGYRCESCKEGYWRVEGAAECVPCACGVGALGDACDLRTGQCACRPRFASRTCDHCELGYGNTTAGCPACACSAAGAAHAGCDARTGDCTCLPGVGGAHCDACLPDHYALDRTGCRGCNCSALGAEGSSCDIRSGQCRCRPHVVGLTCDTCEVGHYGLSATGCAACACAAPGATGACDARTGACSCQLGVRGPACDTCLPGYYGLTATGCLPCPLCGVGQTCDGTTGQCACPPLTAGAGCRVCRSGAWGWRPGIGCQPCKCSSAGARPEACDVITGACTCRAGWAGAHCDQCARGHYGPRCRPCACVLAGSRACDPLTGLCECDDRGQCPCKDSVTGLKCDSCLNGTFGLAESNPWGCTRCFCFGRSSHCSQAGLTWGTVRTATPRRLRLELEPAQHSHGPTIAYLSIQKHAEPPLDLYSEDEPIELETSNSIIIIPETEGNITIGLNQNLPYPLYWRLPKKFLDDHVTSYGGFLRFRITNVGPPIETTRVLLNQFPLVQMRSHGVLVLDYYELEPSSTESYAVRFHESLWRIGRTDVDRKTMMVALQHIDGIFIRAFTKHASQNEAVLLEVSMDTAILIDGQPPPIASGVEMCSCPEEYGASSCQEASIGYWIPPRIITSDATSTIVIQLMGEAEKCHCNGRSRKCDRDTGHCLNCAENTAGRHCEICASGFYGNPENVCQSCPCPAEDRNFATECEVQPHRTTCLCKPGYAGEDCSSCAVGWWQQGDGSCKPCNCSPGGSFGIDCQPRSGQCWCRDFATGLKCDSCLAPQHYVRGLDCVACDNCTRTLLDSVEQLKFSLQKNINLNDISTIRKPYPALSNFAKIIRDLQIALQENIQAINNLQTLPVNSYLTMILKAEEYSKRSIRAKNVFSDLQKKINEHEHNSQLILKQIFEVRQRIEAKVKELKDFAHHDRHLNVHRALKEGKHLIKNMRAIDLLDYMARANNIKDRVNNQSNQILQFSNRLHNHLQRLSRVKGGIKLWQNKTNDIKYLNNNNVWDKIELVEAAIKRFKGRFSRIVHRNDQSRMIYEDTIKLEEQNQIEDSKVSLNTCVGDFKKFPHILKELQNLTDQAEVKESILYRINPAYKETFLEPAKQHAENLTIIANDYKSLFSDTRNSADLAVSASTAYADICAAVGAARVAAADAVDAAARAQHHAAGAQELSLLLASAKSKNDSVGHLHKAKRQMDRVKDMSSELEKSRQKMERIRVAIRSIAWKDKDIYATSTGLGSVSVADNLVAANNKSDRVYENMRALYNEADGIHKDTLYKLKMRLQELQNHGDDKIGGAEEKLSLVHGNIKKSTELAGSLLSAARLRQNEAALANASLSHALRELRDKIARAKHAVSGIQVSLRSPENAARGCVRSYQIPNQSPTTTTRISMSLSLGPYDLHDSVLFHLPSSVSGDFLKIEIVERRIKFSWNLGGDTAFIVYPDMLDPTSGTDFLWYKIDAERIWNLGKLMVHRISPRKTKSEIRKVIGFTNSSLSSWGVLDVGPSDRVWLGSTETPLAGCLHRIKLNGFQIGLWNFHLQPKEAQCTGCMERSEYNIETSEEVNMYHFNGAGYSIVKRTELHPYNRNQFSISLTFQTFDEDALLFMAVDEINNRSVMLSLRTCRVVFRVNYGSNTNLEMISSGRHCSGKPVHVEATRVFVKKKLEKGSLKVNKEDTLGSPNPPIVSVQSLPDLTTSAYWVGGIPPHAVSSHLPHLSPPPLLGCLGDLSIDQEGYNPMETASRYGVEGTCSGRIISKVGFRGDSGYIELPARTLRRKTQFGFMFRTQQPDAALLFAVPQRFRAPLFNDVVPDYGFTTEGDVIDDNVSNNGDNEGFYSMSLYQGHLVLILNAGRGNLKLTSNATLLNDGKFHSVRISKSGRKIEMTVDDKLVAMGSLLGGSVLMQDEDNGMFIGGLPVHLNRSEVTDQRVAATIPLAGAIKDLIFDGRIISLDSLVSMYHAQVGRLGPAIGNQHDNDANLQTADEISTDALVNPMGCQKVSSYTVEPGAVKFGDVPYSHTQVHIAGKNMWSRDLLLEVHFRTFYPNGLLLMTPGSKEKHRHLALIYLKDGRVTLLLKGRRKKEISLPQTVNDGQWKQLSVRGTQRRISIVMAGKASATKMPKKLFLSNVIYVGGLPEKASLLNIPESIWKLSGLKGCVRRLSVNGKSEDLVRDAALHHNVGQCFPAVEKGAHFAGDAYAIWLQHFAVGAHMELRLEFRTAEPNAILLSANPVKGSQMSLELHNGTLVMSVKSSKGRKLKVVTNPPMPFGLCDNAWHSVSAFYSVAGLSLRLDKLPEATDVEANGEGHEIPNTSGILFSETIQSINDRQPTSPLYIGGLPDGVVGGTLISKENFKGCIRNVAVRAHRKDWTDMDSLHNVLLSSCPVPQ